MLNVTLLFKDTDFSFTKGLNQSLYLVFNQEVICSNAGEKQPVLNFIRDHTVLYFTSNLREHQG